MFRCPPLRSSFRSTLPGRLRRLTTVASIAALATLGGPLACDENPFGPATDFVEPKSRLTVEVRAADGGGVAGVALELRGSANSTDSATVYARATTSADGVMIMGDFSLLIGPAGFRLFITPPAGFTLAPGQASPMPLLLTKETSDGPPGSGTYGNPARVVVRLARLP